VCAARLSPLSGRCYRSPRLETSPWLGLASAIASVQMAGAADETAAEPHEKEPDAKVNVSAGVWRRG